MAIPLSEAERERLRDLTENFADHVAAYRRERMAMLDTKGAAVLREELAQHEHYLAGIARGTTADVEIRLRFLRAKIDVLESLLDDAR